MLRIVGVLLAAGRGTRFGGDKLLAALPDNSHGVPAGTPVGVAAALHVVESLPEAVAVVRPNDSGLIARLRAVGMRIVPCASADAGMGASLACGVASAPDADGWVIALADMPWIAPDTIRAVADALASGADMAAPTCRGARGHPVGFSRRHYASLASLVSDAGARTLIERERTRLTTIDVADAGVLRDVDTAADLADTSPDAVLHRASTR